MVLQLPGGSHSARPQLLADPAWEPGENQVIGVGDQAAHDVVLDRAVEATVFQCLLSW